MRTLVELLNTSAVTALAGGLLALAGIVLGWGLRRVGKTQCRFTDWDFTMTTKRAPDGMGGSTTRKLGLSPESPAHYFIRDHEYDLKIAFRMFNEREIPTGLNEPRIYFLKGESVLTHTSILDLYSYREETGQKHLLLGSISLPSREWVEIIAYSSYVRDGDKLPGFDSAELRAKYPGSNREDFRARVPKMMFIPIEKGVSQI